MGQWIRFPDFGNGLGGISTTDPKLIKELELAIKKSIGGIFEVTAEEFEEVKKKPSPPENLREARSSNMKSLIARLPKDAPRPAVAAGVKLAKRFKTGDGELMKANEPSQPTGFRPKTIAR